MFTKNDSSTLYSTLCQNQLPELHMNILSYILNFVCVNTPVFLTPFLYHKPGLHSLFSQFIQFKLLFYLLYLFLFILENIQNLLRDSRIIPLICKSVQREVTSVLYSLPFHNQALLSTNLESLTYFFSVQYTNLVYVLLIYTFGISI